jgi:hypothetical protein
MGIDSLIWLQRRKPSPLAAARFPPTLKGLAWEKKLFTLTTAQRSALSHPKPIRIRAMLTSNQNRLANLDNPLELTSRDMIPCQNHPRPKKQHGGGMNPHVS